MTQDKNGITSQQLLDGLAEAANEVDNYSDGLRDIKRALNQARSVVAQVIRSNTVAAEKIKELTAKLEEANTDRAAKAVEITTLAKSLGDANDLLSDAKNELLRRSETVFSGTDAVKQES